MKQTPQLSATHDVEFAPGSEGLEARLVDLRSRISDAGYEIDEYRAKTAAAMGGGVFSGLLAAGAGYDLAVGKAGIWMMIGVPPSMLGWLAAALGATSLLLFALAAFRHLHGDPGPQIRLNELQDELSRLLDSTE